MYTEQNAQFEPPPSLAPFQRYGRQVRGKYGYPYSCHGKKKKTQTKEKTSRQKKKPHGKKKKTRGERKRLRQKKKPHGKRKNLTAKEKDSGKRKNLTAKEKNLTAKEKTSRQKE